MVVLHGIYFMPCGNSSWWRNQMETFSALLAICAGNSPVHGEFPAQRPVTQSFDVSLDLQPNKRLSKQWGGCWFETPSNPLWRHCNVTWDLQLIFHPFQNEAAHRQMAQQALSSVVDGDWTPTGRDDTPDSLKTDCTLPDFGGESDSSGQGTAVPPNGPRQSSTCVILWSRS